MQFYLCRFPYYSSSQQHLQFHVDNLSSAHIYLRMQEGDLWENIPQDLLIDCAQLTKANSIEGQLIDFFCSKPSSHSQAGNKKDNITVVYTPWSNLKKDG